MRRAMPVFLLLALAACGGDFLDGDDDGGDDDDGPDGGPPPCEIGVSFSPLDGVATAGDTVYATATLSDSDGSFLEYTWTVMREGVDVPFERAAADGSRILFEATDAGPYIAYVDVTGTAEFCPQGAAVINVRAPQANSLTWRLRFVAPASAGVPPQERSVNIPGGANYDLGDTSLEGGVVTTGAIVDDAGAGMPAYLRFTPAGSADLGLDGFAGADGAFTVRTRSVEHDVLIIPSRDDIPALELRAWTPSSGDIVLDDGDPVTGTILDPAGGGLEGATVTVRVDGVPSTVGTTDASGNFAVRARPRTNGIVTVDVVAPQGSGLPRLTTTGAILDLVQPIQVRYAAGLATTDVGGTIVRQGGVASSGARVTITGTIAAAGTLTSGLSTAPASGRFAITATAGGGGALPATLVPATSATAVIDRDGDGVGAPGVVAVDLATAPAAIDAPAAVQVTGRVVDPGGAPISTAELRAVPTGALAAADLDQAHVYAGSDGTFTLSLAGAGGYDLIVRDRAGNLAQLRAPIVASGALGDLTLPAGLTLRGKVRGPGGSLANAAVTIYCGGACVDRAVPAADVATDGAGGFQTTVVDPGTNQ
jgi:hypothetical protein